MNGGEIWVRGGRRGWVGGGEVVREGGCGREEGFEGK